MNRFRAPLTPLAQPPSLPRRLHTQLLASFALVALVAIAAAGSAVVYLMLGYRTQVTAQRLREAGASASGAAFILERQGASPETIAANIASQVPLPAARVLVLDSTGLVVAEGDVAGSGRQADIFVGHRLDVPTPDAAGGARGPFGFGVRGASPADRVMLWRVRGGIPGLPAASGYIFVAPPSPEGSFERGPGAGGPGSPGSGGSERLDRGPTGQPGQQAQLGQQGQAIRPGPGFGPPQAVQAPHRIVLALPPESLPSAWEELAPGLTVAAAIALLAAAAVAWWLAGSIARPIRSVTEATERVARGEPHIPIPEAGSEEVAQLARGFNTMVREVERSQATLRDFVANASHELRTPLTAIQGFSQAVVEGVLEAPEPTRDAAGLIQRESERMRRLVEDLLLLSKMEARDPSTTAGEVDVAELLDTLAQRTRLAAQNRDLNLVLHLPDHLLARGDATQLEHLFGNLLDNAAKYSPEGGAVTVRAALEPMVPGNARVPRTSRAVRGVRTGSQIAAGQRTLGRVTVSVHNTGSYIPAEDLPHIFERFYRVDKSRSREVAGSGLGLAIAKEVAERHGGTIRAESDPVTGTTFTVTLPSVPTPSQAARPGAAAESDARLPEASGKAVLA